MTQQLRTGRGQDATVEGAGRSGLGRIVSVLDGIRPYQGGWLRTDVIAGITLAALAIPETMGYTKIAGMPVITGLYTILLPLVAFALLGSSRHLVVGRTRPRRRSCSPASPPSGSPGSSRPPRSGWHSPG
jgi:hypothetical protein